MNQPCQTFVLYGTPSHKLQDNTVIQIYKLLYTLVLGKHDVTAQGAFLRELHTQLEWTHFWAFLVHFSPYSL